MSENPSPLCPYCFAIKTISRCLAGPKRAYRIVKCDPVMHLSPKTPEFNFGDGLRGSMRARARRGACVRVHACPCVCPRACVRVRERARVRVRLRVCVRVRARACAWACVNFYIAGSGAEKPGFVLIYWACQVCFGIPSDASHANDAHQQRDVFVWILP